MGALGALDRNVWESYSTLDESIVDLRESWKGLLLRSEFVCPFLDEEGDPILNLNGHKRQDWLRNLYENSVVENTHILVHLGVVEHGDELLHEGLVGDLSVEGSRAAIHEDIEQSEREEDHSQLRHLQAAE